MLRLKTSDPGFDEAFACLVRERRESNDNVSQDVGRILDDVRNRGDAALQALTARFDGHGFASDDDWRIAPETCAEAFETLKPELRAASNLRRNAFAPTTKYNFRPTGTIPTRLAYASAPSGARSMRLAFTYRVVGPLIRRRCL